MSYDNVRQAFADRTVAQRIGLYRHTNEPRQPVLMLPIPRVFLPEIRSARSSPYACIRILAAFTAAEARFSTPSFT